MRLNSRRGPVVFLTLVSAGLLALHYGWAQAPTSPLSVQELERREAQVLDRIKLKGEAGPAGYRRVMKVRADTGRMAAIREAAAALSEAEGEDARADAEEKLTRLLEDYFEQDMERREQELADVERRLTRLRTLLERRRDKKEDIIDLQVKVLLNEADGLGFFGQPGPGEVMTFWNTASGSEFQLHAPPPPPRPERTGDPFRREPRPESGPRR